MMRPADPRIDAYLRQLDYALSHLPWEQRQEIFTDVSAHIEREFATSGAQGVNDLLSRFGDPGVIAAEAGAPPMPPRGRGLEITAVILIAVGGFIVPFIGWIVGVVLVWLSSRDTSERLKMLSDLDRELTLLLVRLSRLVSSLPPDMQGSRDLRIFLSFLS